MIEESFITLVDYLFAVQKFNKSTLLQKNCMPKKDMAHTILYCNHCF